MEAFLKGIKPGSSSKVISQKENKIEKKEKPVPWVEKYRPKTVDDVASQDEVVAVLKKTLEGADLPHLLFYGPPGTGKTSTILALARQLFGDMFRSRVLELNASDERGIQVVREKVKNFSQQTACATRPDGRPCPPLKIVILDEADSMTDSAQAALRRTMEKQSKSTRFCLICNYVSRIIEPLTSRCSKFRFKPLSKEIIIERLSNICKLEGIKYQNELLNKFVDISEGDLRKAITMLQSTHRLKGSQDLTVDDVAETAGVIPNNWINGLIKVTSQNSYEKLQTFVMDLISEGYSAGQLIVQIHDLLVKSTDFSDKQKSIIMERLAICDHRLLDGADEYLQIMDFSTVLMEQTAAAN